MSKIAPGSIVKRPTLRQIVDAVPQSNIDELAVAYRRAGDFRRYLVRLVRFLDHELPDGAFRLWARRKSYTLLARLYTCGACMKDFLRDRSNVCPIKGVTVTPICPACAAILRGGKDPFVHHREQRQMQEMGL